MAKKSIWMFREAIKEKNAILKASFFYFLMILAAYAIAVFSETLVPKDSLAIMQFAQKGFSSIILIFAAVLAYLLVMAFIYSFFKIIIINTAQKKDITKNSFNFIWGFFRFNIILGIAIAIVFLAIGAIISYTFNHSPIASAIYLGIFLFFIYPFANLSQLIFAKDRKSMGSMKKAINVLFSRFSYYVRIIITDAVYIGIVLLFFLIVGSIYKAIVAKQTSMAYINVYNTIFIAIFSILFLILLGYNLYFFNKIAEKRN